VLIAGYLALAIAAAMGPVEVELDAPEGCTGTEAFYAGLRSRTDRVRRAVGREPRTKLQVRLTPGQRRVVGELRMIDDRGGTDTRKVQGATCDDVVQALSLTAALALDPAALLSAPTSSGTGTDSSEATGGSAGTAAPDGVTAPAVPPARRPDEDAAAAAADEVKVAPAALPVPAAELSVGALATTVLANHRSAGVAIAARKILKGSGVLRPSLGLAVGYVRNDLVASPESAAAGLAFLAGAVCPLRLGASVLTLQPCAVVMGGWLSATGRGMTRAETADRSWLSAGASLRAAAWLGAGFALELEAGVTAPLLKRRFFATQPGNVIAETPTLAPVVGLGLTYGL
jgi:hypothetical protein